MYVDARHPCTQQQRASRTIGLYSLLVLSTSNFLSYILFHWRTNKSYVHWNLLLLLFSRKQFFEDDVDCFDILWNSFAQDLVLLNVGSLLITGMIRFSASSSFSIFSSISLSTITNSLPPSVLFFLHLPLPPPPVIVTTDLKKTNYFIYLTKK